MKFTVALPLGDITPGEFQTPAATREMAVALEAAGIDACFLTDHPAPDATWLHANGHDALDPFAAFAFVAAATQRLRLHANIVVAAYRNPFVTAKLAATVQVLSAGRLILGLGAGYQKSEFEALGVDFHKRGKLFDEALEVIRMAWAGGSVEYQGLHFTAGGNEPRPVPNPAPLVWIGGGSDKAVQRAAKWGDGWCPFFTDATQSRLNQETGIQSIEQLADKIALLQDLRADLGKPGPVDVAIGPRAKLRYCENGGADEFLQAIGVLNEAGVTWAMVDPPHRSRAHYVECVQWFGEEVIAQMR